ncbi:OmpH family outer membrane protein [Thioflexithrix psekupsensis]|uniref:OmpH family outer membrane protein n=1 Tax=Thioflexithrix psekupsensis TaxID=1570016 RepID=UPI000A3CEE82|nr:OmpH family outer membrane protein [Thioflexithrix psekupsensis]
MESPLKHYRHYLAVALLCLSTAATAADVKIGFVNPVKVMDSAKQVESANSRLEQEFAPRQRRIVSAQQEIKKLEERLSRDGAIMSEDEQRRISRDVLSMKRDLKREQDEFREDYNLRRNEELDKLQKKIIEVIQDVAREENYDFILSDGVVWASERVDITETVLRRLNR